MPTYGYECLGCEREFEVMQSIKDDPLTSCEVCGGNLRKRIYPVGISFKGSGFYVNDYARKSEAHSESKPEASAEAKSETKAEAKSEAKAEPPAAKPDSVKSETKTETTAA